MNLGTTCENCTFRVGSNCLKNPPSCARIGRFNEYPVVMIVVDHKGYYQLACSYYREKLR